MIGLALAAAWLTVGAVLVYGMGRVVQLADDNPVDIGTDDALDLDQPIPYFPTGQYEAFEQHVLQALDAANPPVDFSLLSEEERNHFELWELAYRNRSLR